MMMCQLNSNHLAAAVVVACVSAASLEFAAGLSAAEPLIFEMRAGVRLETVVSPGSDFRVTSKAKSAKWFLTGTVHKLVDDVATISVTTRLSDEDYSSSIEVSETEFKINELSNTYGGGAWGGIHARYWIRRGVDPAPVLINILARREKSFGEAARYFTELDAEAQKSAIPSFVDALNDGIDHSERPPYDTIRVTAADVLGKFGGIAKAAVPALVKRLKDENGYVRVEAAKALWKIEQHAVAVPALRAELSSETQGIRNRAEFGLREIGAERNPATAVPASPDPFKSAADASRKEIDRERQRSMRTLSIQQANLIHLRFIEKCMSVLPNEVTLAYAGPLRADNGRLKLRIEGGAAEHCLTWDVQADLVIFSFWISINETEQTVSQCKIDGTDVFVNVSFIDDNRLADQPLPELGNRSVKAVLTLLEQRGDDKNSETGAGEEKND